ncbi:type II toxin-antitoxin system ParD family antitoxin [Bowmanella dokdonensis]|uniref:Antitoxin ParD n=1 Tax=Bowmanella dokdonensis TaxID=751969 RepID=A0A939IRQ8_9ALTE|nr:type II toxin-antitoxin system ParD family antitoxin [Bowmanella dokdonensis]MBN7825751.1 type II toxin-antitoxin system ParD family antitoxin [Bowmanella dokdonensis]
MATTSLSLGEHWESFIRGEIATGRYGSASEVVRDALRCLEERKIKLELMRIQLRQQHSQVEQEMDIDDEAMDALINELVEKG